MEIYTEIQSFKISKTQKETLKKLKVKKVNVSKFIRDAVSEKLEKEFKKDKRKKPTIEELKQLLNNIF